MEPEVGKDTEIPDEEKKKMCALEYNIKNKGENSYYYAHKSKFEDQEKDPNAKTITGPGIITGGDPILLQTEKKQVEIIKEPKQITKYIFYDDDKTAVVKMDLPEDAKDITEVLYEHYADKIHIFDEVIPFSVKAAEASAEGASIYMLDKNCKVAKAYGKIVEEILSYE